MSVRKRRRRDPKTGKRVEKWMIDVTYRHPDDREERVRRVSPVQTRQGAERYERDVRKALQDGVFDREEVPTLRRFAESVYLPQCRLRNKISTVTSKESVLKHHLYGPLGGLRLDQIDEGVIEDVCFGLSSKEDGGAGLSDKSINNVLAVLSNLLRQARKRKVIDVVPEIEWMKVSAGEFDYLDFHEAERLVAGADKVPEWRCAIVLALKTGMRLGELRALRWSDVDLVRGALTVRYNLWRDNEGTPKNGKTRTLPLATSAIRLLKEHRHLRGERVFLNSEGNNYSLGTWRHGLYRACRRSGLRPLGWHSLRHTFASHLTMRGRSLKEVQELMGHSTLKMTMRYAHLSPGIKEDAVRSLDEPAPDWYRNGTIAAPQKQ